MTGSRGPEACRDGDGVHAGQALAAELHWGAARLRVDLGAGTSLAIPLDPDGPQPAFFAPARARAEPLRDGGFVGDVGQGGSCNAELLHWAPHCHGTHTECIGHIETGRSAVLERIDSAPVLAQLITPKYNPGSGRIPLATVRDALAETPDDVAALVLRTLPNDPDKRWQDYRAEPGYPVLEPEAVHWLARRPLRHLLLDTPSLDAADDPRLTNHRIWWGVGGGERPHGYPPERRSVTELIYVPDTISDGSWWLHLELVALRSDAVPSRPMLYPVEFLR